MKQWEEERIDEIWDRCDMIASELAGAIAKMRAEIEAARLTMLREVSKLSFREPECAKAIAEWAIESVDMADDLEARLLAYCETNKEIEARNV